MCEITFSYMDITKRKPAIKRALNGE
ncbi:hypothetical protein PP590_gp58 [Pseudoalteromonas phage HS1]|nr:hypothetical protein PP589_gp10 [Pseudoalteromonas phage HS5]YP_010660215.1 hypothetical protein PP590_gp58 [Pseudoalteromonas phage HS1]